jgi:uncharacterized membrane protein YtjA (UPF0391 family)
VAQGLHYSNFEESFLTTWLLPSDFERRTLTAAEKLGNRFPGPLLKRISLTGAVTMLSWALTFLVLAIIAAVFGFGGIAAGATQIAQILFFIFLVMFVVSLVTGGLRGRTPV